MAITRDGLCRDDPGESEAAFRARRRAKSTELSARRQRHASPVSRRPTLGRILIWSILVVLCICLAAVRLGLVSKLSACVVQSGFQLQPLRKPPEARTFELG